MHNSLLQNKVVVMELDNSISYYLQHMTYVLFIYFLKNFKYMYMNMPLKNDFNSI